MLSPCEYQPTRYCTARALEYPCRCCSKLPSPLKSEPALPLSLLPVVTRWASLRLIKTAIAKHDAVPSEKHRQDSSVPECQVYPVDSRPETHLPNISGGSRVPAPDSPDPRSTKARPQPRNGSRPGGASRRRTTIIARLHTQRISFRGSPRAFPALAFHIRPCISIRPRIFEPGDEAHQQQQQQQQTAQ